MDEWTLYRDMLRELRDEKKMNQTQVAELLGTTQQVYSRYETGENEMPLRYIVMLAQYYGVSTDYILGLTDVPQPYPPRKRRM